MEGVDALLGSIPGGADGPVAGGERGGVHGGGGGGVGGFAKGFLGVAGTKTNNEQEAAYTEAVERAVQNCVADITKERAVLTRFLSENGFRGSSPQ